MEPARHGGPRADRTRGAGGGRGIERRSLMAPLPPAVPLLMAAYIIVLATGLGCAPRATAPPYADSDVADRLDPLILVANEWNVTDVVPNGERRPLEWVFAELGLNSNRFVGREVCGVNFVAYVCFQ